MSTETKKVRPINRLKSVYPLRDTVDKMYRVSQEAQAAGRPVAWCMIEAGIGHPFLRAMGVEALWPESFGPVCAASGAVTTFLDRAEAEGYPSHLCGYCRNSIGYTSMMMESGEIPAEAPSGGMPKPALLLATGRMCDAHSKIMQALGDYMDVPVWIIEQPHPGLREELMEGAYDRDVRFMVKELREFASFLERLLKKKMDWDEFARIVDGARQVDAVWYEVNELRKAVPGPMHSRDFWTSVNPSTFGTSEPEMVTKLYSDMLAEVKERVENGAAGINYPEKYRITFQGLPPWHSLKFFDRLAERGWNFVTENAYHPVRPRDMSDIADPVERLVRHRIPGTARLIEDQFSPEEATIVKNEITTTGFSARFYTKEIRDFKCDGAFLHPLMTCRPNSVSLPLLQAQLMEELKVPSLAVEGDIVDMRLFNPEVALKRAEAFEETMDHYKEVRKAQGMEW